MLLERETIIQDRGKPNSIQNKASVEPWASYDRPVICKNLRQIMDHAPERQAEIRRQTLWVERGKDEKQGNVSVTKTTLRREGYLAASLRIFEEVSLAGLMLQVKA